MTAEQLEIRGVPAVLYGEPSESVYLFVHGKLGFKEEAEAFAAIACPAGAQVFAVDLPEHGQRKEERDAFNPWTVVPQLRDVMAHIKTRRENVSLRANSIGAFFHAAFGDADIRRALFISPIPDMEKLICSMMAWAGVTEAKTAREGQNSNGLG